MTVSQRDVVVLDRFEAALDPAMPFLKQALDPVEAERELRPFVSDRLRLRSVEVVRHKPGRRCLVEYRFAAPDGSNEPTLLGKARARSTDRSTYRTMQALWAAGFDDRAADNVMVPEPIGIVPAFHMWLQRKVPGTVATRLLTGADEGGLARRIADAARKLHQSGVSAKRQHTPDDELRILQQRLVSLAEDRPDLASRLRQVYDACEELAADLPIVNEGIHRDFYPDQLLVDGPRLYLLDLDLYASGDPALDTGNFIGHLIEQSLREPEVADRLIAAASQLRERYIVSSDEALRRRIEIYTTLTLARHIQISTQFPARRHITERLLELCEERLGAGVDTTTNRER